MRKVTVILAALGMAVGAYAELLNDPGWELGDGSWLGGGRVKHVDFSQPNNETLGEWFGFYAGAFESIAQESSGSFEAGVEYTFSSWAIGGGNHTGIVRYEIGFNDGGTFAPLAAMEYNITGQTSWQPLAGVSYTPSDGAEVGTPIWVRFAVIQPPVEDNPNLYDVWVDGASLVPEPASLLLLATGLLLRRR